MTDTRSAGPPRRRTLKPTGDGVFSCVRTEAEPSYYENGARYTPVAYNASADFSEIYRRRYEQEPYPSPEIVARQAFKGFLDAKKAGEMLWPWLLQAMDELFMKYRPLPDGRIQWLTAEELIKRWGWEKDGDRYEKLARCIWDDGLPYFVRSDGWLPITNDEDLEYEGWIYLVQGRFTRSAIEKNLKQLAFSIEETTEYAKSHSLGSKEMSEESAITNKKSSLRKGEVDRKAVFKDLEIPKHPLYADSYFRGLTELQEVCLRLRVNHNLSPEKIGKLLENRRKSTIQGTLKAALKRLEKIHLARTEERRKLPRSS